MKIYFSKPRYFPALGTKLENFYLQKKYGTIFVETDTYTKVDSAISRVCNIIDTVTLRVNDILPRSEIVRIDSWDVWSFDNTLAQIILPGLKLLQKDKQGSPWVDDEDVPEALRSTSAPPKEHDWDIDAFHHDRWNWVINEMIWAFEAHSNPSGEEIFYDHSNVQPDVSITDQIANIKVDREGLNAYFARKKNGFRLFGKYYEALWN